MAKARYATINPGTNKPCCYCMAEANKAFWTIPVKKRKELKFKHTDYNYGDKIKFNDFNARTFWIDSYENCIKDCANAASPKCNEKKCNRKVKSYISLEDQKLVATGKLVEACKAVKPGGEPAKSKTTTLIVKVYGVAQRGAWDAPDDKRTKLLPDAKVKISGPGDSRATKKTKARGEVIRQNVKPGNYNITITHPDYHLKAVSTNVITDQTTELKVKLLCKWRKISFWLDLKMLDAWLYKRLVGNFCVQDQRDFLFAYQWDLRVGNLSLTLPNPGKPPIWPGKVNSSTTVRWYDPTLIKPWEDWKKKLISFDMEGDVVWVTIFNAFRNPTSGSHEPFKGLRDNTRHLTLEFKTNNLELGRGEGGGSIVYVKKARIHDRA